MWRTRRKRRRLAPGLILGFAPAASAIAQDLPAPLPGSTPVVTAPVPIATHAVAGPPWGPPPVDPVVLERHAPGHVAKKRESYHWRRLQGKMLGYPEDFRPRPLGAAVYDHGRTMVANGEAARLSLFRYDFVPGTDRLNSRGADQLAKFAARVALEPHPLLIEPTPDMPGLAEKRRSTVLNAMASWPVPIAPERVIVARPGSTGLSGIDAQIIGANAMDRTKDYGPPIPINSNGVNSPSGVTGR